MAYVRNFNPLDDQTEVTGQPQGLSQTPVLTTTSADIAANPTATVNPNAQKQGAGGFTNLQRYLSANQGGANVLGGKVSGILDTSRQNALTGMDNAGSEFAGEVAKSTNIFNPNLADQAARDASSYLSNEELGKQLSGTYAGPTNYSGSEQDISAQKTLREAREKQLLADDVGGRTQLIRDVVNTPGTRQTTQGGLNLDQFLVQNTAPVYNQIKSSADTIEPLAQTYFDKATGLQEGVQAAQKTNQATREAALARLGQGTTDLQKQITDMMSQRQAQLDAAARERVYTDLASAGATPEQIASYQTADAAARQYGGAGVDFRNYVTREVADRLGTKDVADAAQAEDLAALAKLTGSTDNFLQAGTKGTGPRLDLTSMLGQLQGQQTEGMYRKQLADQQAAYAAAQAAQQAALDKANADAAAQQAATLKAQQEQQALVLAEMQKLIDAQKGIGTTTPSTGNVPGVTPGYGENWAKPLPRARPDRENAPNVPGGSVPVYGPGESTGGDSTGGTSGGTSVGGPSGAPGVGVSASTAIGVAAAVAAAVAAPSIGTVANAVNSIANAISANNAANAAVEAAVADSNPATNGTVGDNTSATATTGPSGTGAAAAAAASAAASAAAAAGQSDAAQGAAGQAAADAAVGGASASAAAAAGAAAAAAADGAASSAEGDAADGTAGVGVGSGEGDAAGDSGDSGSAASADGDGGASAGDSSGDGGGGGGGGGGKIICTAMADYYGLPYRDNKIWMAYAKRNLTPAHEKGYHKVFLPLVDYGFKQGNGFTNRVMCNALIWIGKNRTSDIKNELAGRPRNKLHKYLRAVIEPTLAFIGRITK